jgi:hypothetical protein
MFDPSGVNISALLQGDSGVYRSLTKKLVRSKYQAEFSIDSQVGESPDSGIRVGLYASRSKPREIQVSGLGFACCFHARYCWDIGTENWQFVETSRFIFGTKPSTIKMHS